MSENEAPSTKAISLSQSTSWKRHYFAVHKIIDTSWEHNMNAGASGMLNKSLENILLWTTARKLWTLYKSLQIPLKTEISLSGKQTFKMPDIKYWAEV